MHGPIEALRLWLSDCPEKGVPRKHGTFPIATSPEIERLKEPDGHRREMVPKDGQTLSQRRSS
jgi:hypothetical protein